MAVKLFIAADDLTGALDTGVQLTERGVPTKVFTDALQVDFTAPAVVVNTESRHIAPEEAAKAVHDITKKAAACGAEYFYKKTDSALRGNAADEVPAMLAALEEKSLCFLPAYPAQGRVTKGGEQYADGVRVSQSAFGRDPFEPVRESDIQKLFAGRGVPVKTGARPADVSGGEGIFVFDAETDGDLRKAAGELGNAGVRVFAGSAGFAKYLPEIAGFEKNHRAMPKRPAEKGGFFVVSGSLNPAAVSQLDFAGNSGYKSFTLTKEQKGQAGFVSSPEFERLVRDIRGELKDKGRVLLRLSAEADDFIEDGGDSQGGARAVIAGNVAAAAAAVIRSTREACFFIIGGDVLRETLRRLSVFSLEPRGEPSPGTVMFDVEIGGEKKTLFSKSGGFGEPEVILDIERYIEEEK